MQKIQVQESSNTDSQKKDSQPFFFPERTDPSTYCHSAYSIKYYQGRRLYYNIKTFTQYILIFISITLSPL